MITALVLFFGLLLLIANGFFVAVEFCVVATTPSALEVHIEKGNKRALRALSALSDISRQVDGAQLGITMSTLALGILAEPSIEHLVELALPFINSAIRHTVAAVIALALVSLLHLLLGEMIPKNLALADPAGWSMRLLPIHRVFLLVVSPLIVVLAPLTNGLLRLMGVERIDERGEARNPAELARLLEESKGGGVIGDFEHRLLAGALDLGEAPASTVMVPWADVATVGPHSSVAAVEQTVVETGHSRLPVIDGSSLRGWVHTKDLLALDEAAWSQTLPTSLVRPMMWVAHDQPLEDVLVRMQRSRRHFAVVLSEEEPIGIVTLEDVLESVVGELIDETDID